MVICRTLDKIFAASLSLLDCKGTHTVEVVVFYALEWLNEYFEIIFEQDFASFLMCAILNIVLPRLYSSP